MYIYRGKTFERLPRVRQLLLERYYFQIENPELFSPDLIQKVKVKREWKTKSDGMSSELRYFDHPDGKDEYYETFKALARRVSNRIASGFFNVVYEQFKEGEVERFYGEEADKEYVKKTLTEEKALELARSYAKKFFDLIYNLKFLPSSPFMFNAGRGATPKQLLILYKDPDQITLEEWKEIASIKDPAYGSCYAMGEVPDTIDGIYEMLRTQAEVFRHAGGFGTNFSKLRSKYADVSTIKGKSSGPLMFMRLFNETTYVIALHASTRRGANMFHLNISHPEIEEFIDLKTDFDKGYQNIKFANISVGFFDTFFDHLFKGKPWKLVDPHDPSIVLEKDPLRLWTKFSMNATLHAEPGFTNWDTVNSNNPFRNSPFDDYKKISSTNPCVVGDTKVLTKRGLVNAKDLKVGDLAWDPISKEFQKVEKVYDNGEKDILKIILETGAELLLTPEHQFVMPDGSWKKASELKVGDTVLIAEPPDFEYEGEDKWIEDFAKNRSLSKEEAAWMLAAFLKHSITGDEEAVTVTSYNSPAFRKLEGIYDFAEFDYTVYEYDESEYDSTDEPPKDFPIVEFIVSDEDVIEFFNDFASSEKIPEELFTSSTSVIAAFMAGFIDISDPEVKNGAITFTDDHQRLLDIQKLWQLLGGWSIVEDNKIKLYVTETVFKKIQDYIQTEIMPTDEPIMTKAKIMSIEPAGKARVYDATIKPNYVWVTNTALTADCSEFVSVNNSVCVLGSMNVFAYLTENEFDLQSFQHDTQIAHTFLTIANFANEFPLDILTLNTRRLRNTGIGVMGVASTLIMNKIRYGTKEAFEFVDKVMSAFRDAVVKNSFNLAKIIGRHFGAEYNANVKIEKQKDGKVIVRVKPNTFKNEEVVIETEDDGTPIGLANAFLMAIAPTGSISYLANVSSGVEPIFSCAYNRRINPDLPNEYTVTVYDEALFEVLTRHLGKSESEARQILEDIANNKIDPKSVFPNYVVTAFDVSVPEKIAMLVAFNSNIDMNSSTTFNIPRGLVLSKDDIKKLKEYGNSTAAKILSKAADKYLKHRVEIKDELIKILSESSHHCKAMMHFIASDYNTPEPAKDFWLEMQEKCDQDPEGVIKLVRNKPEFKRALDTIQSISDFYLLSNFTGLKGTTVYVEATRTPILTRKRKKKEASEKKNIVFDLGKVKVEVSKQSGHIVPKSRPAFVHSVKKQVKFKFDGATKKVYVEVGFDDKNEPFEVFYRATESTKEFASFFNLAGRMLSLAFRSGVDRNEALKQLRKVKNWRNEYEPLAQIIYDATNEIIEYVKASSKKKRKMKDLEELKKNWVLTPKGYYIDEEGKARCPVCGDYLKLEAGCASCMSCGYSACTDV